jgi:hypothetical protein
MQIVKSGYGNAGDFAEAREKSLKDKPFRFLIVSKTGGDPTMLGGSFSFQICGTDTIADILRPKVIRESDEIFDTKIGKRMEKSQLATLYLKMLGRRKRLELKSQQLVRSLTQ